MITYDNLNKNLGRIYLASQPKVNWWKNIPSLTAPMDLVIPALAQLNQTSETEYKSELHKFCDFLAQHPLAIAHNKSKNALKAHMELNIGRYMQGKSLHH